MKRLLIAASLLALAVPVAQAQQGGAPDRRDTAAETEMMSDKFLVFFGLNESKLTPEAQGVVAKAAQHYKETGAARIVATGHTDTTGPADYNLRLSEQRAEAVADELVRLGVPETSITTVGEGQTNLLVPTGDGVNEPQNRRVSIEYPIVVAAKPAPVVATKPAPLKWAATLGPWVGWNLREKDPGNPNLKSMLVGPEVRLEYAATPKWVVYGDIAGFNTVGTSASDGYGGRGVVGLQHQWNFGDWHPFIGPSVGYIAGKGTQDGVVAGPQIGVNYDVAQKVFLYGRAGYDHNFRNEINQGIVNGGIGAGLRF